MSKVRQISGKLIIAAILAFILGTVGFAWLASPTHPALIRTNDATYTAEIVRDSWGVPHITGERDADVAFGLAYAHAEDDFATIQGSLLAARGKLASAFGKDSAPNDYMVGLFRIWEFVDAGYESQLSPEVRAICEGYAAGLNQYALEHPAALEENVYPFTGKDVVAGFVHKLPLFFGVHKVLAELFEEKSPVTSSLNFTDPKTPLGSNAIAVAPSRSSDGRTMLAINSHQPWEGPVAWYEAHLHSTTEGWDITGGVFPGAPLILHGHTPNIGWAHTVNHPDLIDVYELEINPDNPEQYKFDGEWRDLEKREIPIEVELWGPISWTFYEDAYWSVHGPVVKKPHAAYAIRFSRYGELRQVEQWFRMNKATDLASWKEAMAIHAIPMFNTVYADKEGNIGYIYNAALPMRSAGANWAERIDGSTGATLWDSYLPFENLPMVFNPASGFVQNCNNTPFATTIGDDNPKENNYPPELGIESIMTNRAQRSLELFGSDSSITRDEFYRYKYDMSYSRESVAAKYMEQISNLSESATLSAELQKAVEVIEKWNLSADPENQQAALALLTLEPFHAGGRYRDDVSDDELMESLEKAASELTNAYGALEVPWQRVNRLIRGDVNIGMGGSPDVLHAIYGIPDGEGIRKGIAGESYILLVDWDKDGKLHSQSIHQFGSATLDKQSPHYADQSPIFASRQLKPLSQEGDRFQENLTRQYQVSNSHR